MATRERESGEGAAFRCAYCGEPVVCDVARIDAGRLYHLRCFHRHVLRRDAGLRECPQCDTAGRRWIQGSGAWIPCPLCGGSGYLSEAARIPAASLAGS